MEQVNGGFSETGLRMLREVLARHVESGGFPGSWPWSAGVVRRTSKRWGRCAQPAHRSAAHPGRTDDPNPAQLIHDFWTTTYRALDN